MNIDIKVNDMIQCITPFKTLLDTGKLTKNEFQKIMHGSFGELFQTKAVIENNIDAYLFTIDCGLPSSAQDIYKLTTNYDEKNILKYQKLINNIVAKHSFHTDLQNIKKNISQSKKLTTTLNKKIFRNIVYRFSLFFIIVVIQIAYLLFLTLFWLF